MLSTTIIVKLFVEKDALADTVKQVRLGYFTTNAIYKLMNNAMTYYIPCIHTYMYMSG